MYIKVGCSLNQNFPSTSFSSVVFPGINCALAKNHLLLTVIVIFSCPPAKMPWKHAWRASKLCIWKTLLARHCRTPTFLKFIRARLPVFGKASIKSSNICHIPTLIFELITLKKRKETRSDLWHNQMQNKWRILGQHWDFIDYCVFLTHH